MSTEAQRTLKDNLSVLILCETQGFSNVTKAHRKWENVPEENAEEFIQYLDGLPDTVLNPNGCPDGEYRVLRNIYSNEEGEREIHQFLALGLATDAGFVPGTPELNPGDPGYVAPSGWHYKAGKAWQSGSESTILELEYVDPSMVQELANANHLKDYTDAITLEDGTVLPGKWFNVHTSYQVNPDEGWGTLYWYLSRHYNEDLIFSYRSSPTVLSVDFFKTHMFPETISTFQETYYFDTIGNFYISTDTDTYTNKNGDAVAGNPDLPDDAERLTTIVDNRKVEQLESQDPESGELTIKVSLSFFKDTGFGLIYKSDHTTTVTDITLVDANEGAKQDFLDHTYTTPDGSWYYIVSDVVTRKDGVAVTPHTKTTEVPLTENEVGRQVNITSWFDDKEKNWNIHVIIQQDADDLRFSRLTSAQLGVKPAKNVQTYRDEGFNVTKEQLDSAADYYNATPPIGTGRNFEFRRLGTGLYTYTGTEVTREGVVTTFDIGMDSFHLGFHMPLPPTTDPSKDGYYVNPGHDAPSTVEVSGATTSVQGVYSITPPDGGRRPCYQKGFVNKISWDASGKWLLEDLTGGETWVHLTATSEYPPKDGWERSSPSDAPAPTVAYKVPGSGVSSKYSQQASYNDEDATWSWRLVFTRDELYENPDNPSPDGKTALVEYGTPLRRVRLVKKVVSDTLPNNGLPDVGFYETIHVDIGNNKEVWPDGTAGDWRIHMGEGSGDDFWKVSHFGEWLYWADSGGDTPPTRFWEAIEGSSAVEPPPKIEEFTDSTEIIKVYDSGILGLNTFFTKEAEVENDAFAYLGNGGWIDENGDPYTPVSIVKELTGMRLVETVYNNLHATDGKYHYDKVEIEYNAPRQAVPFYGDLDPDIPLNIKGAARILANVGVWPVPGFIADDQTVSAPYPTMNTTSLSGFPERGNITAISAAPGTKKNYVTWNSHAEYLGPIPVSATFSDWSGQNSWRVFGQPFIQGGSTITTGNYVAVFVDSHGLQAGDKITISGVGSLDGSHLVAHVPDADTFTIGFLAPDTFSAGEGGTVSKGNASMSQDYVPGWFYLGVSQDAVKEGQSFFRGLIVGGRTMTLNHLYDREDTAQNVVAASVSAAAWRNIIRTRLRKYFVRRPTVEDLEKSDALLGNTSTSELGPAYNESVVRLSENSYALDLMVTRTSPRRNYVTESPDLVNHVTRLAESNVISTQ